MRYVMLAAVAASVGFAAPAMAAKMQTNGVPSFDDCYRLAWVRGVHLELNELPGFSAECMAGNIPFDSGNPATSIHPSQKNRQ
jgi:hypothetical protein